MNKAYRIITTCLIAVGAVFLGLYFGMQNEIQKFMMLERPSYYILQNYWYFFLAGIAVLFFSLLGSFFSWFRAMEEREKVLPNAGYSNQEDITKWLGGTSLDTRQPEETAELPDEERRTELLEAGEHTELLDTEEHTELLDAEERTVLLETDERTELLGTEEQTELIGTDTGA